MNKGTGECTSDMCGKQGELWEEEWQERSEKCTDWHCQVLKALDDKKSELCSVGSKDSLKGPLPFSCPSSSPSCLSSF